MGAVKEVANAEVVERIIVGSIRISICNNLTKNMTFSQESCQAIIEMDNTNVRVPEKVERQ